LMLAKKVLTFLSASPPPSALDFNQFHSQEVGLASVRFKRMVFFLAPFPFYSVSRSPPFPEPRPRPFFSFFFDCLPGHLVLCPLPLVVEIPPRFPLALKRLGHGSSSPFAAPFCTLRPERSVFFLRRNSLVVLFALDSLFMERNFGPLVNAEFPRPKVLSFTRVAPVAV